MLEASIAVPILVADAAAIGFNREDPSPAGISGLSDDFRTVSQPAAITAVTATSQATDIAIPATGTGLDHSSGTQSLKNVRTLPQPAPSTRVQKPSQAIMAAVAASAAQTCSQPL